MGERSRVNSIVVIPARMASSRLPGKPLIDIAGKSLIQRTYEQCLKAIDAERIYVATDDIKIREHCENLDIKAVMTSQDCLTGTDRVAEVAQQIDADYYINVQGDEPLINPLDILDVEESIARFPGEIINGYAEIVDTESYRSLTIPKLVFRPDGRLLYMSRSPIPGNKENTFMKSWRQVCVYAFPKGALMAFASLKSKTMLESMEDLEILRFLEMGYEVRMIPLSKDSIAVDTPHDVEKVLKALSQPG
jgi:3-deoxy-manno-octulosonate cytidylyltransferase (CMP-KDO synthetase)